LRFNQLPQSEIIKFLSIINQEENLNFSDENLELIQKLFNSDIRSMINYMQSNEEIIHTKKIIQHKIWTIMTQNIMKKSLDVNIKYINNMSIEYNIAKKNIIKNYLNYIIRNNKQYVTSEFLSFVENIMHTNELNIEYTVRYMIITLKTLFT